MSVNFSELAVADWLKSSAAASVAEAAASAGRLAVGETVGAWRVTAFLGSGLSAEVYRVTHCRRGHEGALKLLIDETRGLRERFLAEASAIRTLALPSLPLYLDAGEHRASPFYVMEYLQPLPDPMPRREVLPFMLGVAGAVGELHAAGYIHRDLKHGNLMRRRDGEPVLIDLGLLKRRGAAVSDPVVRFGDRITLIDGKPVGVGTLDYAAPEQLLRGEASVQSDIFSLGKILRRLFEERPPRSVEPIIRRATCENPADRYASAEEFAAAIRHRHRPRLVAAAAALALAATIAAALLPRKSEPRGTGENPPPRPPTSAAITEIELVRGDDESPQAYLTRILPAAAAGNAAAQIEVAKAHFFGRGTATNRVEGFKWYLTAARSGDADAQATVGYCRFNGIGCELDQHEAVRWFSLAADKGNLSAMTDLAYCRLNGMGTTCDREAGFRLALAAAEGGYVRAQTLVGECFLLGRGVAVDREQAENWLARAAAAGERRAKKMLQLIVGG